MIRAAHTAPLTGLAIVLGCGGAQTGCPPVLPRAVAVDVRDSVTGASLVTGARGAVFAGGALDDSLRPERLADLAPDSLLVGGWSVGRLQVRVEHVGYQPWLATNVQTRSRNEYCAGWDTQILVARLQPETR